MEYQVAEGISLYNSNLGSMESGQVLTVNQVQALKKANAFDTLVNQGSIVEVSKQSVKVEESKIEDPIDSKEESSNDEPDVSKIDPKGIVSRGKIKKDEVH